MEIFAGLFLMVAIIVCGFVAIFVFFLIISALVAILEFIEKIKNKKKI